MTSATGTCGAAGADALPSSPETSLGTNAMVPATAMTPANMAILNFRRMKKPLPRSRASAFPKRLCSIFWKG
ncbi:hypothetical protein G6F57_017521 [Rhizopus arrhizus]|nr:hypothetical protein G6F57_017521 [Rhizopus arrhizus]